MKKQWWKSKTLWFNAVVAALAALEVSANFIQPYVAGDVFGWGMAVLTMGNAVLRVATKSQLVISDEVAQ